MVSCNILYFKVYFVWYQDCYSWFLLISICMEYIFPSSHFQSNMSLYLKRVSCRQHMYVSWFCIHSTSLCLLVGACNPFTFKVIIDMYVPIAVFLIVCGWFVDLCSSPVFLDYISPFNICFKVDLVVLNSLNFCLSEKLFISPSILNEILAGYSNLHCWCSPFSMLNIPCHSLLACRVSAERSTVKHMGFLFYITCCFYFF